MQHQPVIIEENEQQNWVEVSFLGGEDESENPSGRQDPDINENRIFNSTAAFLEENGIQLAQPDQMLANVKHRKIDSIDIKSFKRSANEEFLSKYRQQTSNLAGAHYQLPNPKTQKQGRH